MNIVFMGTPDFAATVLRHVAAWPGCEVVAAYCQPDRPAGRGHKLQPPAVKVLAQELGIPVFQPLNFKDEADRAALAGLRPDALVVAAYPIRAGHPDHRAFQRPRLALAPVPGRGPHPAGNHGRQPPHGDHHHADGARA